MKIEKYSEYAKHIGADEHIQKWVTTTLSNYLEKNQVETEEVEHILDYLVMANKRVSKMSYIQAKEGAEKWLKAQIKKGNAINELPEDVETVLDFGDGFRVVKLVGENAYKREGFLMSHCVASYYGHDVEVYSLRDSNNMPHATMEKDQQIKGKGNGDIHPKYIDYVVKFLEHVGMSVGDSEMKHLGYINISKWKNELSKETIAKCYGDYIQKDEQLIGKDGEEFASLDLWDVKDLVSVNFNGEVSIQSNLAVFLAAAIKRLLSKKSKTISDKNYSRLAASGNGSLLAASGDDSQLAASGNYSRLEINGKNSVGMCAGADSKIKGKIGNWITLSEWEWKNDDYVPVCVKSALIDGKKIKEDTWYQLKNGEFVEYEI